MIDIEQLRHTAGPFGYWYLATPYTKYPAGIEEAWKHACQAAGWLTDRGVPNYCPIAESHPIAIAGGIDPRNHDIWIVRNRPLLHHAVGGIIVQMPEWTESYGVKIEMDHFRAFQKPMHFLPWPLHL